MYKLSTKCENFNNIIWPNKCIVCNGENKLVTMDTECSVVERMKHFGFFMQWNSKIIRLEYKICIKHYLEYWIPTMASERNLFNLAVCYVAIILLIPSMFILFYEIIQGKGFHEDIWVSFYFILFSLAVFVLFLIGKYKTPIKINGIKDDKILFTIRNDNFATELLLKNQSSIETQK